MNKPPDRPLTDGVVTVRVRHDDDLKRIAAARLDPAAGRWLDQPPASEPPRTADETAELWRSGRSGPLTIADAVSDEAAGLINLQFRGVANTSMAYQVFQAWRGRGFAARAVELLTGWAFSNLGLARLVLEIDEENIASVRVAQRCGFTRSGWTSDDDPPKAVFVRESPASSGTLAR